MRLPDEVDGVVQCLNAISDLLPVDKPNDGIRFISQATIDDIRRLLDDAEHELSLALDGICIVSKEDMPNGLHGALSTREEP